jgi:hypothetical protein
MSQAANLPIPQGMSQVFFVCFGWVFVNDKLFLNYYECIYVHMRTHTYTGIGAVNLNLETFRISRDLFVIRLWGITGPSGSQVPDAFQDSR